MTASGHIWMESEAADAKEAANEFKAKHGVCPDSVFCHDEEVRIDVEGDCDTCGTVVMEGESFHVIRKEEVAKMFCDKCFWIQGGEG